VSASKWRAKRAINLFVLTLVGVLATACGGIGSNALYEMLKDQTATPWMVLIATLALVATALLLRYLAVAAIAGFHGNQARQWRADKSNKSRRRALVLMPSLLRSDRMQTVDAAIALANTHPQTREAALTEVISPGNSAFNSWPWQQSLRLVERFPDLQFVCIVQSSQTHALKQGEKFAELLKAFRPKLKVVLVEPAINLTDYDDIEDAIYSALEKCRDAGFRDKDVCIDITGGTKSFSAVAAIRSLNTGYVFSYVVTNQDTENSAEHGKVYLYDASVWSRRSA
jgi:hypothetical protein